MNSLPLDLIKIINEYKNQMIHIEHNKNILKDIKKMYYKIEDYINYWGEQLVFSERCNNYIINKFGEVNPYGRITHYSITRNKCKRELLSVSQWNDNMASEQINWKYIN